jgi:hypothetical protein
MRIIDALPPKRYAAAAAHARSDQFKALKAKTIARVQQWYADPRTNQNVLPGLWFGYGKDSMAGAIILKTAGLDFCHLTINNGGDLPQHWIVQPEWEAFFGENFYYEEYETDRTFTQIIRAYLDWGNLYGIRTKEDKALNFWDWGGVTESITYEAIYQFDHLYGEGEKNVMYLWANRQGEGQERAFEIARAGMFQFHDQDDEKMLPYIRALPLGEWKDIDVWALLVSEDSPISPIYSMHQIPQKKGNKAFPRTLWYCTPEILCSQYYKWLAFYAPVQLKELCALFPEITTRFTAKSQK